MTRSLRTGALAVAGALSGLAGCAAPSAGTATSPVTIDLRGARFCGSPTVTLTVTITPTSEAAQRADARVDAQVSVPVKP